MSGHSKFANIKHKKGKNDAAKGKIFTKIGREIAVAVKEGGGSDPTINRKLRDVIVKAKSNNMPNDTIQRSIKKAVGEDGSVSYEHITYEGYGPNGVAVIVETLTDNRNRTAANVRAAFSKGNGNMGTSGCVAFMFDKKGQIVIEREATDMDEDELMMLAIEAGAEDFESEDEGFTVITDPEVFSDVYAAIEATGIEMAQAEITMVPQTLATITAESDLKGWDKMIGLLEDDDDVQNIYHNYEEAE
ncbi:MAG: YebC/PmpR family DNA-binding transcriptional regulator [Niameybacter sp.]|uniref:YebC/PmpR family DNA-binding transcriptional regulator n=1 Tax=Niameybacter sp. TaxID=2033640 RepID=UPI002FC597DC